MALKLRKDIKKSSYYVWFLGAKESKGLRGPEFILPVIKHLEEREKDVEPFKVTLQVSAKGLKIVQAGSKPASSTKSSKSGEVKHFVPHSSIACVLQRGDVVACILLLFNPVTRCPLHVHAYRCDGLETAQLLRQQLQALVERPDNQKKFAEIETRILRQQQQRAKAAKERVDSSVGSDTGTSTRESESSEERFGGDSARVATLYDSVAAELRAKLCKKDVPILLPPRDYDTVHRQKGNLTGIELRRCLNANIVGQHVASKTAGPLLQSSRRLESSGGSSGIGSDHPPSPDSPEAGDTRFNPIDSHSTSDEEWTQDHREVPLYLMNNPPSSNVTLPRPLRNADLEKGPGPELSKTEPFRRYQEPKSPRDEEKLLHNKFLFTDTTDNYYHPSNGDHKKLESRKSLEKYDFEERRRAIRDDVNFNKIFRKDPLRVKSYSEIDDGFEEIKERKVPIPKTRQKYNLNYTNQEDLVFEEVNKRRNPEMRQRTPTPDNNVSPRDRFRDAKEKFLLLERDRFEQEKKPNQKEVKYKRNEKYYDYDYERDYYPPKSTSRNSDHNPIEETQNIRYRRNDLPSVPLERYRNEKFDPKRRSMFSLIEEEHKKNSSEIAKELKRRSYLDSRDLSDSSYLDLPESDRFEYPRYAKEVSDKTLESKYDPKFVKNQKGKNSAGYRHSYAEPKLKIEKNKKQQPMFHQQVSNGGFNELMRDHNKGYNGGRVGIASVHPY